jgi:tripartite-type tricarboxylate transporter receptor subunit TctC
MRRRLLIAAATIIASFGSAIADVYPSRAVTIVVPFAAGGPTDSLARLVADRMKKRLGRSVIVENVTGAGGTLGVAHVVRAEPDGYTVGIGNWSTHVINGALYPLRYDLLNDLEPVALLPSSPQLVVASNSVPANDLAALMDWLRTRVAAAGTAGVGSASHAAGLYFQSVTATKLSFVPYRGAGPALQDLMGGQIDVMFDQSSNSLPHTRAGKIKAYAVTSRTRLAAAPDIPTVDEAGLPGFHISVWHGLWAPKGTPRETIATLKGAVADALADPDLRRRFAELGQEIPTLEQQTPEALARIQKADIDKWWPIIRAANIRGE